MKYTYEINLVVKIIIVRVFGDLYTQEVALMDKDIRSKAKELNYKIIFDYREAHNHISIVDAYYWYTNNYFDSFFNLSCIPVAKITNDSDKSFFHFFETTLNNKGVNIKMCSDEISAYKWLENF